MRNVPQRMGEGGRAARRNLEGRLLDRALNRQPCGVIYLDPGAFSAPDLRRVLALKTHVMFIERDTSSRASDAPRSGFLYRFLSRKTPIDKAKSGADTVIEAGQLEALAIAQLIVRKLKSQDGPHLRKPRRKHYSTSASCRNGVFAHLPAWPVGLSFSFARTRVDALTRVTSHPRGPTLSSLSWGQFSINGSSFVAIAYPTQSVGSSLMPPCKP